jgi:predicted CxxxxCH...CXXCH cytochrome family protein
MSIMERCSRGEIFLAATALLFSLLVSGCGDESKQSSTGGDADAGNVAAAKTLPTKGKVRLATAPAKTVFGMIWIDTTKNREYIYDGAKWVPHDQTVEAFYKSIAVPLAESMTPDEVCLDGDPNCTPTGAHGPNSLNNNAAGHAAFACSVCHKVGGRLKFDRNGPAYAAGNPAPTFDATAKTCSNVACHGVPAGTFSYYFPGGDGEPVLNTVNIIGNTAGTTPSWYSTGAAACGACHGNPPRNGTDGSNVWHSGNHAGGPTSANNQCQMCHPDASGSGGQGTTITNPSMHGNGIFNVQATFRSSCFNCH